MFEKDESYWRARAESKNKIVKVIKFLTGKEAAIHDGGFEEGALFGYNKANEWHYVKAGDLPSKKLEEKQLLVKVRNYTEDCIFAYYMLDKYYSKNSKRFYSDTDCDYPIDIDDIIAWKEIELPKE